MTAAERAFLTQHSAHDSRGLIKHWRQLARTAGWECRTLAVEGNLPVLAITSPTPGNDGLYISAGMHGDEPAPPLALFQFFQEHHQRLAAHPVALVPCFNPAGLLLNTRTDGGGEDLNRMFHREDHPLIAAWHKWMTGRRFRLALCLHEDYDAQGCYCYELHRKNSLLLAADLMKRSDVIIPRDGRRKIDRRRFEAGILRRIKPPTDLPGLPEAIALHLHYAEHCLTFETPSEFSLHTRVQAHQCFLEAAVNSFSW